LAEREAEREARREEQEAMLQQLLLMQELGVQSPTGLPGAAPGGAFPAAGAFPGAFPAGYPQQQFPAAPGYPGGFPQQFAPPGYPAAPAGYPQQPYYGPPAAPGAVSAYPGQTGAVPGPPSFPGQTYAPGPYGPPAFAQRPQYMQSAPMGIPQQQAPPGMQWAQFDPAAEMFGMGNYGGRRHPFADSAQAAGLGAADQPVGNPRLKGAQVELGYNIYGPSLDASSKEFYTFEAPDGASWTVFADQVIGPAAIPQQDPRTNRIVYVPPPGGAPPEEDFDWASLQRNLRQFTQTGVQAYQQVALTRELEKGARQARREARGSGFGPVYDPAVGDVAFGERRPIVRRGGVPLWALGLTVGTIGLGIALAAKKR
jgi:hypothetical protein